ncbi:MAG: YciI family protein [Candidatus Thorarchaeota archaeon]
MEKLSYVIMLRPAPSYGEEETEEIVGQHFKYLQSLQVSGELVMVGRFSDVLVGLTMIECDSLERATEIMKNDPAVKANIFHAELYPWRVALNRE